MADPDAAARERFVGLLLAEQPQLRAHVHVLPPEDPEERDLIARVPSPTGDTNRDLVLWMDDGCDPSLAVHAWHTHAYDEPGQTGDEMIVRLVGRILRDEIGIAFERGSGSAGWMYPTELDAREEWLDSLTSKQAPDSLRIWTWTGAGDLTVTLDDLADLVE